jgi:hypothetical protein
MAEFVGCIEAGAIAKALIGTKSDDGPVGEVDAECIDLFDTDAKTNDNDPVHLEHPHNIANRAPWHVPMVANLSCRLLDVGGLKRLPFVNRDAWQVEVGQRDVLLELERKFPREVHVGESLLAISRGG